MKKIKDIVYEELKQHGLHNDVELTKKLTTILHNSLEHCDFDRNPLHFFQTLAKNHVISYIFRKEKESKSYVKI